MAFFVAMQKLISMTTTNDSYKHWILTCSDLFEFKKVKKGMESLERYFKHIIQDKKLNSPFIN